MRLLLSMLVLSGCATTTAVPDASRADGGSDVGIDAGHDGGSDAGSDGGVDGGLDASDDDASDASDGSIDASTTDAGPFGGIVRTADPETHPSATPIAPFTTCTVSTFVDTFALRDHHEPCEALPYPYLPPSAGPHYCVWSNFQTYTTPVPWPFLVHDLEHGAVVLAYHCENDADCDPIRTEFDTIIALMGVDPVCRMETNPTRFIVVPAPDLPVPIAAIAWTHLYEATCLDSTSLRAFVSAHYGMGPETLCDPGVDGSSSAACMPCPI